jgi:hypothetical protein
MNRACADEKQGKKGKVPSRRGGYLVAFFFRFADTPFAAPRVPSVP